MVMTYSIKKKKNNNDDDNKNKLYGITNRTRARNPTMIDDRPRAACTGIADGYNSEPFDIKAHSHRCFDPSR